MCLDSKLTQCMNGPRNFTEGTAEALEEMLSPRVDITGIEGESDEEKVNAIVFELYKEALSVVNLAANMLDGASAGKGGWPRNQAICAGLLVRIAKFMLVVTQLSAKGDRAEVVSALNRSIMESAINLEFLIRANDDKYFDQFVRFSLGPERELYDLIQANVAARKGVVWPIERRMLESVNDVCSASGVKIEDAARKYGDWGGGTRERLKALNKEEQYVSMLRLPSHAVHGTWVDLYKNHLEHNVEADVYNPDPRFSWVDARLLAPIAVLVLEAVKPYLERFFSDTAGSKLLQRRTVDLQQRIVEADTAHEKLFGKKASTSAAPTGSPGT